MGACALPDVVYGRRAYLNEQIVKDSATISIKYRYVKLSNHAFHDRISLLMSLNFTSVLISWSLPPYFWALVVITVLYIFRYRRKMTDGCVLCRFLKWRWEGLGDSDVNRWLWRGAVWSLELFPNDLSKKRSGHEAKSLAGCRRDFSDREYFSISREFYFFIFFWMEGKD